jgi:hypothetical protein
VTSNSQIQLQKERYLPMYGYLRIGAQHFMDTAKATQSGRLWELVASLMITAFMFEGYLNHVGVKRIRRWDEWFERLPWRAKLELIANKFNLDIDHGKRPFQSVKVAFEFRDDLAHPKTRHLIRKRKVNEVHTHDFSPEAAIKMNWETLMELERVEQIRADVTKAVEIIHRAVGFPEGEILWDAGYAKISTTRLG